MCYSSRIPSMKTYSALKKKLKSTNPDWMQGFLEAGGLEVKYMPNSLTLIT